MSDLLTFAIEIFANNINLFEKNQPLSSGDVYQSQIKSKLVSEANHL